MTRNSPIKTYANRLNSPFAVVAITAILYGIFIFGRLMIHQYDISCFIDAGFGITDARQVYPNVTVHEGGYDGQYFYRLALNPFTSKRVDYGVDLVDPSYRHQRILYPFLVWLTSMGNPRIVPYSLVLVNFIMVCLIGFTGALVAKSLNMHLWWGLAFSLYPGFIMSVCRNLSEVTAAYFVLTSLLLFRADRLKLGTLLLCFGVLARETTLLVAAGFGITWLITFFSCKEQQSTKWFCWAMPLTIYICIQFVLWLNWGQLPLLSSHKGDFGLPLFGFMSRFLNSALFFTSAGIVEGIARFIWLVECIYLVVFTVSILILLRPSKAPVHEKFSWILYLFLASIMTWELWRSDQTFLRVITELYVIGLLILFSHPHWVRRLLATWAGMLWIPVAAARMKY